MENFKLRRNAPRFVFIKDTPGYSVKNSVRKKSSWSRQKMMVVWTRK